jgi:hypothetical protein
MLALSSLCLTLFTDAPPTSAPSEDKAKVAAAELSMLRRSCATQLETINQLKAEIARLNALIKDAGIDVQSGAMNKSPRRIVFLIDTSGSMMGKRADFTTQVKAAISGMKDDQLFNLICISDNNAQPLWKGLFKPDPVRMKASINFLDEMQMRGSGNPDEGLKASIKLRPDVIWFLTDGDVTDKSEIESIAKSAKIQNIKINTVIDLGSDPVCKTRLYDIAQITNGKCINLKGEEVMVRPVPSEPQIPSLPIEKLPQKSIFDP